MTDYLGPASVTFTFQQRLYFLRLLKAFNTDNTISNLFYTSVVESIVLFNFLIFWFHLNNRQREHMSRLQK